MNQKSKCSGWYFCITCGLHAAICEETLKAKEILIPISNQKYSSSTQCTLAQAASNRRPRFFYWLQLLQASSPPSPVGHPSLCTSRQMNTDSHVRLSVEWKNFKLFLQISFKLPSKTLLWGRISHSVTALRQTRWTAGPVAPSLSLLIGRTCTLRFLSHSQAGNQSCRWWKVHHHFTWDTCFIYSTFCNYFGYVKYITQEKLQVFLTFIFFTGEVRIWNIWMNWNVLFFTTVVLPLSAKTERVSTLIIKRPENLSNTALVCHLLFSSTSVLNRHLEAVMMALRGLEDRNGNLDGGNLLVGSAAVWRPSSGSAHRLPTLVVQVGRC